MDELWQLYDEQGRAMPGKGGTKAEVLRGLLHAASHVWIYRKAQDGLEVLLQKRGARKKTWPNLFDISAAGHIDLGEDPLTAAIRETKEEIGLDIPEQALRLVGIVRYTIPGPDNAFIENEFGWVYLLELEGDVSFALDDQEVDSLVWKKLSELRTDLKGAQSKNYVPHGDAYVTLLLSALAERERHL